jgi:hypothetical protein
MVRAAASGLIDYSEADPSDRRWNIKHKLVISELIRQSRQDILKSYHTHVCAYLSHSNLTEESFTKLKQSASDAYQSLRDNMYPWLEKEPVNENTPQNSKIDAKTQALIDRYKEVFNK